MPVYLRAKEIYLKIQVPLELELYTAVKFFGGF